MNVLCWNQGGVFLIAVTTLSACGSASPGAREHIARTEAMVQHVERSGMTREAGALELEQAKDKISAAQRQLEDGNEREASWLARQAELDADLAQAKARSHEARQAVAEMRESIEQLHREALSGRVPATWNKYGTRTYAIQPPVGPTSDKLRSASRPDELMDDLHKD